MTTATNKKIVEECILAILSLGPMKPSAFSEFGVVGRETFWRLIDKGYVIFTGDQKLSLTEYYWEQVS